MNGFEYHSLDDDALALLEDDWEAAAQYLDFLTVLHDAINTCAKFGEPSVFDEAASASRMADLIEDLPTDFDLRLIATENQEKALAILDKQSTPVAEEFNHALLREYNVVRLLRCKGRSPHMTA